MQEKVVIIYDGINHSIFEGQVLNPLLKELHIQPGLKITLISFENKIIESKKLELLNTIHPNFKIFILKKTQYFFGYFSILFAKIQCKKILSSFSFYSLQARGPFAGAIAQSIISSTCIQFTLQARGLLAEEFLYTHEESLLNQSWYKKIVIYLRYKQLFYFEQKVYQWNNPNNITFIIESVSQALEDYLKKNYYPSPTLYTHAINDIPATISIEQKKIWRNQIRTQLKLHKDHYVYIYNGSCKPWQCFKETILYFKKQLHNKKNSYLLIITPDIKEAFKIVTTISLPENSFHIESVSYTQVYAYLCASDSGIILRKKHILNWVSRPTKVLEYKAAHLPIIHNNTIAYLNNENQKKNCIKKRI